MVEIKWDQKGQSGLILSGSVRREEVFNDTAQFGGVFSSHVLT